MAPPPPYVIWLDSAGLYIPGSPTPNPYQVGIFAKNGILYTVTTEDGVRQVGGGASNVLPDGSTLAGEYDGDVFVDGSATIGDNVIVKGSLIIADTLLNDHGYGLTVHGNLIVENYFNWSPYDYSVTQHDLEVYGDFLLEEGEWRGIPDQDPQLIIHGDFILQNEFDGRGQPGAGGLRIDVFGDCTAPDMYLAGGYATPDHRAGNGGSLQVRGDLNSDDEIDVSGGDSEENQSAGDGGSINVYGNAFGWFDVSGGDCDAIGSGGNGGYLEVYGSATLFYFNAYGGNSHSTNAGDRAGNGGSIYIYGGLSGDASIYLSAGNRYGSISAPGSCGQADAGSLQCEGGDGFVSYLELNGGGVYTDMIICNGGNGGNIYFGGNVVISDGLAMIGGDCDLGTAGNGGHMTAGGRISSYGNSFYITGGGSSNQNGSGGTLNAYDGIYAYRAVFSDGGGPGDPGTGTTGLFFNGATMLSIIDVPDRADGWIQPSNNNMPASLKVSSLSSLKTLSVNSVQGPDISADTEASTFVFDPSTGLWYKYTGVPI